MITTFTIYSTVSGIRALDTAFTEIPYFATQLTNVLPNKTTTKNAPPGEASGGLAGRILALDPGAKRVGVAISDELRMTVRPLKALHRTNWKKFLSDIKELLEQFDARVLVIGLPLSLDGVERSSAIGVRQLARKLVLSLDVPIFLQDERLTSREAEESLHASGHEKRDIEQLLDSVSAVIILRDFMANSHNRTKVISLGPDSESKS